MGANRKLQIEIDRTLKKVAEGIEVFDEIWEKVYETDQIPLKEKYEADLKKEIKKLQRYRDTIKTWISGSDIKDKTALVEARKSVERQMERFKVCEKETKTKTFSKEGLAQAQKQDPKEKARNEMRDWINTTVDTLTAEVENFDAEVESLQPKKKGKPPPRLTHAEESATRHRAHIQRLEQILRLLDNETIEPEDIQEAKELVDDYIMRNQDDFDEFSDPDDLYADLLEQLDNLEAQQPVAINHIGKGASSKDKDNKEREKEREKERNAALAMKMQLAQGGLHVIMDDSSPEKPSKKSSDSLARTSRGKPEAAKEAPASSDPAAEGASSAAAESAPSTPGRGPTKSDQTVPPPPPASDDMRQAPASGMPAGTPSFAAATAGAPQRSAPPSEGSFDGSVSGKSRADVDARKRQQRQAQPVIAGVPPAPLTASQTQPPGFQITTPPSEGPDASAAEASQPGSGKRSEPAAVTPIVPQSNMAELPANTRTASATPTIPPIGYSQPHLHLLQASATRSLPTAADRLWGIKSMRTRLLPHGVPASYPDTKLPILDSPQLFEKLETEALFFAFYYQPETYQQYLAARELKRQSWRYHKQHGAWFQRHEEPKTATEEYEQGTYVYFDYNIMHDDLQSGWCYRLKQDFTFRYDALEDELQV